ncbi:Glycosyltransferase AglG [Candidatus Methanobinarius endosymbioticus]|uniref:Glycosyltransferase AglG n=1 Tax=Candidatus Methanobinarius endosymbioticus TaxID=2006182 RepID=A0A366M8U0_9EURY|nr:Glycosyltransferase AglG [Candidatus Methanobinarius endosymbioticus]
MDVSIIIVNYKTFELTKDAVESVLNTVKSSFEIIIVDNDSQDDSYENLRNVFNEEINNNIIKTIANSTNKGFAAANNLGIKISKGKFVLLLNSDTIVKKGSIDDTLKYIKNHDDMGAIGCKIVLPNGKLDKACKRSFPNPKNSFYRLFGFSKVNKNSQSDDYNFDNFDDKGIYEVDSLVGAFMFVRKETIHQIGLLDEDYFMYGEDIDWCYRIKEGGWKVLYYGAAEIIHHKGSSSKKQKNKLIYEFYRAMYLFYNKHYKNKYSFLTRLMVYIGISFLFIVKLFLNIFKK